MPSKFVVSLADNTYKLPSQFLECESLADLLDVFTDYGTETVVPDKNALPLAFAAEFDLRDGKKDKAHIVRMHPFMALDLDDTTPAGFGRALSSLRELGGVAWYTTYSWTPESPCVRFLVLLDRAPSPEEYERCWHGFQALLGGQVDTKTRDFSRGYYVFGRPPERAPGRYALHNGPVFSVDAMMARAGATALARQPLVTGDFDLGADNGAGWRAVLKRCKGAKSANAKKALEFLEPAMDGRAWGGKGDRNEAMSLAMFYAVLEHGERGIDVQRSVDYFAGAVAAVKRVDPSSGTSIEEMERTLAAKINVVTQNRQEADRFAPLLTDDGCAKSIAAANHSKIRYVHSRKQWHAWTGKRWATEAEGATIQVHKAIVAFSDKLLADAARLGEEGNALKAQGLRLQSASAIKALMGVLENQAEMYAAPGDFDPDPFLLNLQNGVYDQRSHRLLPHDPKFMITKIAPVSYDPGAKCPRFDAFLQDISLGRDDWADYVMRVLGYCTTGDVSEHKFWLFTGDGRNGKGTLINTVFRLLGSDYAVKCASDMFTEKYVQKHAQEVMKLQSKRLAYISEVPKASAWDTMKLKAHSGGDILSGNRMRENDEQFEISHKILILANEAPSWDADDKALARRMKRVPFDLQIPEGEEDKGLEAALASELPGILNRLLKGVRRWQEIGFGPVAEPQCVRETTQAYREENDPITAWLEDKAELGPENRATRADAWTSWNSYCIANGLQKDMGTQISFGKRLAKRFQPVKGTAGVRCWQGFSLKGQSAALKPN